MKMVKTKELSGYTKITLETNDGEIVELEVFKDQDVIRINSGFSDLFVKPRTSNEIDINIKEK